MGNMFTHFHVTALARVTFQYPLQVEEVSHTTQQ